MLALYIGLVKLNVLPGVYAICRLPAGARLPEWALRGEFYSVTRTPEEVSAVCAATGVPEGIQQESGCRRAGHAVL